jgi:hypothetical protein
MSSGMKKTGERMSGIDLLPSPPLFSMQQVLIYKRLSSMQENTCGSDPVYKPFSPSVHGLKSVGTLTDTRYPCVLRLVSSVE